MGGKVRVNPGNYADKKKFAVIEYTDSEYAAELERIERAFTRWFSKPGDSDVPSESGPTTAP